MLNKHASVLANTLDVMHGAMVQSCKNAYLIPGRVDIEERLAHIEHKVEVGHWEDDRVYGQDSCLVTMVERVTKILLTCPVKTKTKKCNKSHQKDAQVFQTSVPYPHIGSWW